MRCRGSTDSNVVTGGVLRLRPSHRRPLTAATTDQLCASSPRQRPERRATVRNVPGTRSELYRSERSVTLVSLAPASTLVDTKDRDEDDDVEREVGVA